MIFFSKPFQTCRKKNTVFEIFSFNILAQKENVGHMIVNVQIIMTMKGNYVLNEIQNITIKAHSIL